ncbi:MAG: hypothetical protein FWH48_08435 [Oscillospiraceae bacterium]|nr:hypothetical protein [Oscillospiraceae bacterium]
MAKLDIKNAKFYIDGAVSNPENPACEGRLIGVCSDVCAFFDGGFADIEKTRLDFIKNLSGWRASGVDIVTLGLQSPSPFREHYKKAREQKKEKSEKNIEFKSSALKADGSLDKGYLENAKRIIEAADGAGLLVCVNIFSAWQERIFEDEYAILNGAFNVVDWLLEKNFSNVMVNITDVSHIFYKSSVLCGGGVIRLLKSLKERADDSLILGAGLKSLGNIPAALLGEYIKNSDFVPIYSNAENAKLAHNTKKMLGDICFLKGIMRENGADIPIIMAKGDDLGERYNSYGKNNLAEALENGISWFYYDREGFFMLPVDWDKDSSQKKRNFFDVAGDIKHGRQLTAT